MRKFEDFVDFKDVDMQDVAASSPAFVMDDDEEEFANLVALDIKGRIEPEQAMWLREPDNVDRFYDTLVDICRSVDIQLLNQKAASLQKKLELGPDNEAQWDRYQLKTMKWKVSILRFKRSAEQRIAQVRRLRALQNS